MSLPEVILTYVIRAERDAVSEYRIDSFFVKDSKSCIRKLSHLVVCDLRDREWVLNEVRVNSENIVNVCPVLINVSTDRCCEDGTCDVGTASGECDDLAALGNTVETGEDKELICLGLELSKVIVCLRKDDCFACFVVL